jgi:PAS domain S-box-containing protein
MEPSKTAEGNRVGQESMLQQLQLAVDAAGIGVWQVDLQANTITTIQGNGPITGLGPPANPTSIETFLTLVHPEDRETVDQCIQRAFEEGDYRAEFRIVLPTGEVRWVSARGQCRRDAAGRPLFLTGIDLDVTERRKVEEALYREQVFTRAVLDSVPGLLYLYDEQGRLVRWNKRFEEITGYSAKEVAEKNFMDWFQGDEESAARISAVMHKVFRDGYAETEARLQTRQGRKLFYFTGVRLSIDGQPYLAGIGIDMSARQHLEEQFRHAQKMEAVGQLAGGVAHDFNNLLTVIQSSASLLLDAKNLADEDLGLIKQISEAAERAGTLTRQLLLFGRKQVPQFHPVNLSTVVGDMTKLLRRVLGEDIALQAELAPALPVIRGDIGMLEQIILNLAVNARDAMPRGGRLRIASSVETVGEERVERWAEAEPGTCVRLEVCDTGSGIAPQHLPHIFEPFFTTKPVGRGTGLGLASVYGIVKQHRGWIEVESEPGKGSAFRIYLPVAPPLAVEPRTTRADQTLPRGQETILVVEDEPAVRMLVVSLLQRCGYNVLTAATGVAALEVWKEHRDKIRLLLTDMIMPGGMTGRELAERLRAEQPSLKVIYTSGYSVDLLEKAPALVDGFNFLQKPYQSQKLAQTVRKCLDAK